MGAPERESAAGRARGRPGQRAGEAVGLVTVGCGQDVARFVIPENEPGAGISRSKHRQTLPGKLKILQTFQPHVPAIRVFDYDVVRGLDHRKNWCSQGGIPPVP